MKTLLDIIDDAMTISEVIALMQDAQTINHTGGLGYDIEVRLREAFSLVWQIEDWDYRETLRCDMAYWLRFDWYDYSF